LIAIRENRRIITHEPMKTKHIFLLTATAAALVSCNPVGLTTNTPTVGSDVPAPKVEGVAKVPLAHPTPDGKKDTVISPYRPYNVIDVKGYKSGDIVGDPSTAKVNPATGKLDLSTSKHFRIP